jgi:hypothetical protein
MAIHPIVLGLLASATLACAFAAWKGGGAERIAALIIVLNLAVSTLGESVPSYRGVGSLTVDALTAFGFLALTLKFGRPWLGLTMLIFALQFALHAFYFVTNRSPHEDLHAQINNVIFVWVILCLLYGTVDAIRRRRAQRAA